MGYCMEQRDVNFHIDTKDFDNVINALKKYSTEHDGAAWVSDINVQSCETIEEIIYEYNWDVEIEEDGINDIYFSGEKLGDEDGFFEAIAPFVKEDSYIEMSGEDGTIWRWLFKDGHCNEVRPTITW